MRRLGEPERRSSEDLGPRADEPPFVDRVFLQHDAGETVHAGTVVPQHVHQILPAVIVVKERRIEPAAVEMDRLGPLAVDRLARHQIVVHVARRRGTRAGLRSATVALDVRVNEPEATIRVRETRRPDAARVGITAHVELTRTRQRPGEESPVHEIARVVDLHTGVPLERRRRDVVVVAHADDRRIRVEAPENWIEDGRGWQWRFSRRAHRRRGERASSSASAGVRCCSCGAGESTRGQAAFPRRRRPRS